MFSERRCAPRSTKIIHYSLFTIIHYSLFTILSIKKQGFGPAFLLFLMVPYCDTDRFIV